ncbi:MAG: hypothetical protein ABIQ47_03695 [Tepidiformaceae bacterium]
MIRHEAGSEELNTTGIDLFEHGSPNGLNYGRRELRDTWVGTDDDVKRGLGVGVSLDEEADPLRTLRHGGDVTPRNVAVAFRGHGPGTGHRALAAIPGRIRWSAGQPWSANLRPRRGEATTAAGCGAVAPSAAVDGWRRGRRSSNLRPQRGAATVVAG